VSESRGPGPLWRKAPLMWARFPQVFGAVAAGVVILAVVAAGAPLFLSSAANAALEDELDGVSRWGAGLQIVRSSPLGRRYAPGGFFSREDQRLRSPTALLEVRDERLARARAGLDHLGPTTVTILGPTVLARGGGGGAGTDVRLLNREGDLRRVDRLTSVRGRGVWISDAAAEALSLEPGDTIDLALVPRRTRVRVKGVYRELAAQPRGETRWWSPLWKEHIYPEPPKFEERPTFLLADRALYLEIGKKLDVDASFRWELPLDRRDFTLAKAEVVAEGLSRLRTRILDRRTSLGRIFYQFRSSAYFGQDEHLILPELVAAAKRTAAGIESPVRTLSLVGSVVALGLLAVAGVYSVQKRRIEHRLLTARGVHPAAAALRTAAEALVPATVAATVGVFLARGLMGLLGPGSIDPGAVEAGVLAAALSTAAGVAVFAVASAIAGTLLLIHEWGAERAAHLPWDLVILAGGAACFYGITTRGALEVGKEGGASVDLLLVVFPVAALAGAAGVVVRGIRSVLPMLRRALSAVRPPVYLALSRLGHARGGAPLFVVAAAVAIGVLMYSSMLVSSVDETTYAKSHVFTGSEVSIPVDLFTDLPHINAPSTVVVGIENAEAGGRSVAILGVDTDTFASAAYWDGSFSDRSLVDLLGGLERAGEPLPVVVAGAGDLDPSSVRIAFESIPVATVGRAEVWPGMLSDTPVLVTESTRLEDALRAKSVSLGSGAKARADLWVKGDAGAVRAELAGAGFRVEDAITSDEVGNSSALRSISWTFGLLRLLGILSGALAVVGMVLYLSARQRARTLAYALAGRMGLTQRAHRAALLIELASMLTVAFGMGVLLGAVAVRLVYRRLDLLPGVPPSPLLRLPSTELVVASLLLAVAGVGGAWWVQRIADRTNYAEVMRGVE
jgi:putative ABC transport system permease protein